jgi:hypothetical protein
MTDASFGRGGGPGPVYGPDGTGHLEQVCQEVATISGQSIVEGPAAVAGRLAHAPALPAGAAAPAWLPGGAQVEHVAVA